MTVETLKVQDLPEDCRLNILSFLNGKPEHQRIKRNRYFTVFQMRCRFRHHVFDTKVEYDYINGGKLYGLYKKYEISSLLYTPKTILKEHDRFEKFFGDTMDELLAHRDYNVYLQSFTPHWEVSIITRRDRQDCVYYFDAVAFSEQHETMEDFLMEAVDYFKKAMDRNNEKEIEKIRFSALFYID